MSIPQEVKLKIILEKKADIRKATDEISECIKKLGKGNFYDAQKYAFDRISRGENVDDAYHKLDEQKAVMVRQKLHQIMEDVSTIAGFCDKSTRVYVMRISKVVSWITSLSEITNLEAFILESFCTNVNTIIVDYDKTPFSASTEFKVGFDKFFASIKRAYRKGIDPI